MNTEPVVANPAVNPVAVNPAGANIPYSSRRHYLAATRTVDHMGIQIQLEQVPTGQLYYVTREGVRLVFKQKNWPRIAKDLGVPADRPAKESDDLA